MTGGIIGMSCLVTPTHLHRPAEQTFAVHQQTESYTEEDGDLEDVFAVGDRPPWTNRRYPNPATSPTLQQMFALVCVYSYTRCVRSPDSRMPNASLWGAVHSLIRIEEDRTHQVRWTGPGPSPRANTYSSVSIHSRRETASCG